MSTRYLVAITAAVFGLAVLVQIWNPRIGLSLMFLSILSGQAAVLSLLRNMQARMRKHERFLLNLQKSVQKQRNSIEKGEKNLIAALAGVHSSIRSIGHAGTEDQMSTSGMSKSAGSPEVGRASTPEVSNPFSSETLYSMLKVGRQFKVAGIFESGDIPECKQVLWNPGTVVDSLEQEEPELVVIDEQAVQSSPIWAASTSAVGTALMKELLQGVAWAKRRRVPVCLLTCTMPPDIHSAMLRNQDVLMFPLNSEDLDAASGAPQSKVMQRLQEVAAERVEKAEE